MSTIVSPQPKVASLSAKAHGVEINQLRMVYRDQNGNETEALRDINLQVEEGEFCVLLGPSGCGKTTLLRCIAGLEIPSEGNIEIGPTPVFRDGKVLVEPQKRPVGMVFQSYALWPHLSVAENVAYPLTTGPRRDRLPKTEINARVHEVLTTMQIDHLADRRIGQLSGGQQQRVALARAVAAGNRVVLFDEPLSNIDAKVREDLRAELKTMQKKLGFTAVYVTHDQIEALDLADKVVVLDHGRIVQTGTPNEVYFKPKTEHVASFIGTSNLIPGTVVRGGSDRTIVRTPLGELTVPGVAADGDSVKVVTRANEWSIHTGEPVDDCWTGTVEAKRLLGSYTEYAVRIGETELRIWDRYYASIEEGDEVRVTLNTETGWVVADGK